MLTQKYCIRMRKTYHRVTMNTKKILLISLFSCFFSLNQALADFTDIEYSWYRDSVLSLQNQ